MRKDDEAKICVVTTRGAHRNADIMEREPPSTTSRLKRRTVLSLRPALNVAALSNTFLQRQ